jgi:hypothetical protein
MPTRAGCAHWLLGVAMSKRFAALCILQLVSSHGAFAQNVNNLLNMFGGLVQQGMILPAQTEWRKLPPNELSCLDQTLRQQRSSVDVVVSRASFPPLHPKNMTFRCDRSHFALEIAR